ncbi:MAG: zinc-ribbon domain-containing protein [Oscillospiraceae bacterium]|nr:zinc-ribbon domain-containing protein [Oscillospiraceae bacterium]
MNFLQRFFIGRNGTDQLNITLAVTSIACTLLSWFMFRNLFTSMAYVTMFLMLFRMISRNIGKRQQENALFLQMAGKWGDKIPSGRARSAPKWEGTNYRYLNCPNCRQQIRVPTGKGNVKITCSKCGHVFYERT